MRRSALIAALVLIVPLLAGCIGAESRSDWAYDAAQITALQDRGRTGEGVVVAVLDTGIDPNHPSLRHLVDGDRSNGELIAFRDFRGTAQGVGAAFDEDGHGTHVAGIISARGSGFWDRAVYGADLMGGAPSSLLVVARVCDGNGCDGRAIASAIRWAVDAHGAQVVSLSLGGQPMLPPAVSDVVRDEVERAVNDAIDRGAVVVAAAGNKNQDRRDVESPASIRGVIAVGAVDRDLRVADFSQRGDNTGANACRPQGGLLQGRCFPDQKPELVAPGVDILGPWTDGGYVRATGTSQATPFVSSVVALMLEGRDPLGSRSDVQQLKEALASTARPLSGQQTPHDAGAGYGLVQAQAALDAYRGGAAGPDGGLTQLLPLRP